MDTALCKVSPLPQHNTHTTFHGPAESFHLPFRSDVLKMDIEYSEFDSMTAFLEDFATTQLPIGQLLVEIHLFEKRTSPKQFLTW